MTTERTLSHAMVSPNDTTDAYDRLLSQEDSLNGNDTAPPTDPGHAYDEALED